jgi:hypothetical protein
MKVPTYQPAEEYYPPAFHPAPAPVPFGATPYGYAPQGHDAIRRAVPYPYGFPDTGGVQSHFGLYRGPGLPW